MREYSDRNNVLHWYDPESPEVSVIVLNFNGSSLTKVCLEKLWSETVGIRYEIIIVDNGSSAEDFVQLTAIRGPFRLVRLAKNRFFGEGNNIGVELSAGKYIAFLNNDAFVEYDWLRPLVRTFEEIPNVGGVGPLLLYPDGTLQEAGAFIDEAGDSLQVGKRAGHNVDEELFTLRAVDYCSAACFLTTREYFDIVGGFDFRYEPAYYEDVDLCLKLAGLGKSIYFCPYSRVIHIENATSSRYLDQLSIRSGIEVNRSLFLERWGSWLQSRAEDDESEIQVSYAPALVGSAEYPRPRVAFYTPYDLIPGGGERYLLTAASALSEEFDVEICTDEIYSSHRLRGLGKEFDVDVSRLSMRTISHVSALPQPCCLVAMGNEVLPPVHGFGRRNLYVCQFPFPMPASLCAERWERLNAFDEVVAYSQYSQLNIQSQLNDFNLGTVPITIVSPPVALRPFHLPLGGPDIPIKVLCVGRFFTGGHTKRHDIAIRGLIELRKTITNVELHIVGSLHHGIEHRTYFDELKAQASGMPVFFHPNARKETLDDLLRLSSIYWHAAGFGIDAALEPEKCEHFGISILEAMGAGCVPLVFANGGPMEFVHQGETGFVYTSVEDLISKTAFLIANCTERVRMAKLARIQSEQFGEKSFAAQWRHLVRRQIASGPSHPARSSYIPAKF